MAKKRKKKFRSHVKRLKHQQKLNPMSPAVYKKKLRKARRKDFARRFVIVIIIICVLFLAAIFGGNYLLEKKTGQSIQEMMKEAEEKVAASSENDFRYAQTTYIYSDQNVKLAELSDDVDATYIVYEDIPEDVVNAFVAIEDRTFWTNGGIDYKGMARVLVNFVRTKGKVAEGASTITQQLARGAFLSHEKTLTRKIKEIFIARELTKKYSKEQIMEFYCNTCCFANGIYGVEDAAKKYLGKSVDDLTLSETAYICAIPNRPEYYNPLKESLNAIKRRDKILEDMVECGYIMQDACDEAKQQVITIAQIEEDKTFYNYEVTYAINCAVRYLMKLSGFEFQYKFDTTEDYNYYNEMYDEAYSQAKHELYTGGYEIYTSINVQTQRALQNVLDEELFFNLDKKEDGSGIYDLQGAMTVIDNDTGKVIALIGGRSQDETSQTYSLNRAFQSYAQPGSSFKPLAVYTPALNEGFNAASPLRNIDVKEAKESKADEIAEMYGEEMALRTAVEKSENGCAYWLFNTLTPRVGLSYVTDMNFTRIVPEDYTLSASLGGLTHGVSTVEMANAYSALENHGQFTPADCIMSILDSDGNEIYEEPQSREVYSHAAADEMTDIMKGVITQGTASRMNWYNYTDTEAAGKTGTTNDYKAAWFCGYTPYYTIAVWVGCDTPKTVKNLQGGTYPASIWKSAMLYLIQGLPDRAFELEGSYADGWLEEEEELSEGDIEKIIEEMQSAEPEVPAPEEVKPETPESGGDNTSTDTPEKEPESTPDSGSEGTTETPSEPSGGESTMELALFN